MNVVRRLADWLSGRPERRPAPPDAIAERLHAAIEANACAKCASSDTYARRVQTMIDDLLLRMDRDAPPQP